MIFFSSLVQDFCAKNSSDSLLSFYLLPVLKRESLVCWFVPLTTVFDTLHYTQFIGIELRTGLIGWLRSCHCFPIAGLV